VRLEGQVLVVNIDRRSFIGVVLDAYAAGIIARDAAITALDGPEPPPPPKPQPTAENGWAGLDQLGHDDLRRLAREVTGKNTHYIQSRWGMKSHTLRRLIRGLYVEDLPDWERQATLYS
jgi:hypothetical protein